MRSAGMQPGKCYAGPGRLRQGSCERVPHCGTGRSTRHDGSLYRSVSSAAGSSGWNVQCTSRAHCGGNRHDRTAADERWRSVPVHRAARRKVGDVVWRIFSTRLGISGVVARQGSAFCWYFMDHCPRDWHDLAANHDFALDAAFRGLLVDRGIFVFPLPPKQCSISAAHTPDDIDLTLRQ